MSDQQKNDFYKKLCYVGGILCITSYIIFLIIAWILFPNPATPLDHWLSDLGRYFVPNDGGPVWRWVGGEWITYIEDGVGSQYNPGAIFYNLGCIIAGISMILFFIGFFAYKNKVDKVFKIITNILIVLGIIGGIGLILIGIFAEDGIFFFIYNENLAYIIHHNTTIIFFLILMIIKIVSGYWTWKLKLNPFFSVFAWAIIIFDIIVVFTGNNFAIVEWLSVLTSLGLVGIIDAGLFFRDRQNL
ncbi:MAG: hypothetical protein ACQERB_05365 [Promethearchaeati archaeon]